MKLSINNYKKRTKDLDFSKHTEDIQMVHAKWEDFVKHYQKSDKITEMIDNHLKVVEPLLKKSSGKTTKKDVKTKPKATPKKTTSANSSAKKTIKTKQHKVPQLPFEVKIINSYLRLYNKTVTERQIVLLYQKIHKAAAEKEIRKTSKFVKEIINIGNDLAETYREMGKTCKFIIPDDLHKKLEAISDSYRISPVTNYIKRFINLYDDITQPKAKRLLTNIKNAKKKKKVTSRNSGYKKLIEIQAILENFIHSDKLQVTTVQLNGLKGIAELGK